MEQKRNELLRILRYEPVRLAHAVGFDLLTDLHNEWIIDMVYRRDDETLQSHRGSYKTTCVSFSLMLIMILFPNDRTAFIRKTDADVKEIIHQVHKMIQSPLIDGITRVIWNKPLEIIKATSTEIQTNLTNDARGVSQLVGMGIKGSITGKHFDRIFTDDIVNVEDRVSKAEREHTKLIYQELQNIRNRGGGRIVNTGTPWHKDDCFLIMPNIVKYDVYSTNLISEIEQEEIKASMLPSLYAANYELKHIASEDVIFTNPVTGYDPSVLEQCNYCHVDAAYGGSDYTAFTICKKKDGKYYVFGKLWHKHVDECQDSIVRYRKQFKAGRIYCEDNGDKGYLAKELRKKGETVTTYHEGMNKLLKILTYLKFNWSNVVFVEGTDKDYLDQILEFTELAEHDDAPDSLACLIRLQANKSDTEYRSIFG